VPAVREASVGRLSRRLETVLSLLQPCELLADVGTDHGLLPIAAASRGLAQRALAVDLREEPLRGAQRNIKLAALEARVSTLQGDGVAALAGRGVDAVVMAGLSGRSLERLCREAPHVLSAVRQLVLQPNQGADTLRAWAFDAGFHVRDEVMVEERGRIFVVLAFAPGAGKDPAYALDGWSVSALCKVGPLLLARKDALARRFCEAQRDRLAGFVKAGASDAAAERDQWQAACEFMR
jgi:tRNA (adenine22-N1)-methyltransferase